MPLVRRPEQDHDLAEFSHKLQVVSLCTIVTWWIQALEAGATEWDRSTQSWTNLDVALVSPMRRDAFFV